MVLSMLLGVVGLYVIAQSVCLLHELAHVAAAKWRRIPVLAVEVGTGGPAVELRRRGIPYTIYLWPGSGDTRVDEANAEDRDLLLIGVAGPASNLLIGALLWVLSPLYPWGWIAACFSLVLGLATLIGVSEESDGSRIRQILRSRWRG